MNKSNKFRLKKGLCSGLIAAAFFLSLSWELEAVQKKDIGSFAKRRKLVLMIIDFQSFFCLPCTETFLDFCQSLPPFIQEEALWGVIIYKGQKKIEDNKTQTRVIEKKLRGFIEANDIRFPIILDSFHIFHEITEGKTAIILFNQKAKIVRKFLFPLNEKQRDEIINFLSD